ncbi:hypothetical protein ONS95_003178 [Cadophora gregata]|uniref:uncharacterized protein n=1 Tax=Cadophora gregata TaxID=51156 RepID=UPI0026DD5C02|nr:uncharacterized protein ONS95_003178 [Cadophora gregata]KAK0108368.1 hypothetical protein ONS95_003178 [Cadophora gregata]KAK0109042.1 hypothetical protein ONS96_002874 [Cadophora gregata f. sp. sojae]
MDSMRSLDTSLPRATPITAAASITSKHQDPPEQLLTAFKAAALSVTNLYKSAAVDQGRARAEGYQDALDELLTFLDKEDIGLSDGEGWRVRRWATERLDGRDSVTPNIESDDEASDKAERGSSPTIQRSQSSSRIPTTSNPIRAVSPMRTESAPPTIVSHSVDSAPNSTPSQATFTFRSAHPYPQDADIILSGLDISDNTRVPNHDGSVASHTSNTVLSGLGVSRPPRTRHNNHTRIGNRPNGTTGRGGGQKRKINFGEFFDIGNLGQGRDGFGGGGKRGRFA